MKEDSGVEGTVGATVQQVNLHKRKIPEEKGKKGKGINLTKY